MKERDDYTNYCDRCLTGTGVHTCGEKPEAKPDLDSEAKPRHSIECGVGMGLPCDCEAVERVSPSTPRPAFVQICKCSHGFDAHVLLHGQCRVCECMSFNIGHEEFRGKRVGHSSTADLEREAREWLKSSGNEMFFNPYIGASGEVLCNLLAAFVRERDKK